MDQIFSAIFNYINYLINHIRPKKRIYIAIDGVAPRAKMNNQRQRRYHSAKANRSLNEFLTGELHTSPGVVSFKNNSISPGTEFMMDLIDKIKLFIKRKIFEDDSWKHLSVFMSGGDVPGEGEHKIMDWLRGWKQSPDFDINESHCIYSNDADLIFLSLSLHLPKIVILREVQKYDDKHVNAATKRHSEEQGIELLFINLLREYLELEYQVDRHRYKQQAFDIERIIDDFILIAFFIGNDFLHQLYCMSTKKGNFDEIIDSFKRVLPGIGGYLSDKGRINWSNFLAFLKQIAYLENKMIKTTLDQMIDHLRDVEKNQANFISMSDSTTIDDSNTDNQTTEDQIDDEEEEAERRRGPRDEEDDEEDELEHEAFDEDEMPNRQRLLTRS
jgi:5'-3' exoribonuclease 1